MQRVEAWGVQIVRGASGARREIYRSHQETRQFAAVVFTLHLSGAFHNGRLRGCICSQPHERHNIALQCFQSSESLNTLGKARSVE